MTWKPRLIHKYVRQVTLFWVLYDDLIYFTICNAIWRFRHEEKVTRSKGVFSKELTYVESIKTSRDKYLSLLHKTKEDLFLPLPNLKIINLLNNWKIITCCTNLSFQLNHSKPKLEISLKKIWMSNSIQKFTQVCNELPFKKINIFN